MVDSAADTVKAYRLSDGAFEFQFGSTGSGPAELSFPISAAVSATTGEVYVGDSRNRRVSVFNGATGGFQRDFGTPGGGGGEISFVGGLHVDALERVYVAESLGGFVQVFDPFGGFISKIGDHGQGPAQLRSPKAVVVDRYNRLLVTSFLDDKIEVWGIEPFQNPVDEVLEATVNAIPNHIHPNLPSFQVIFQVPGLESAGIDPDSLRINGAVAPLPGSYKTGPHLSVRFRTSDVLASLPAETRGSVTLALTGVTLDGEPFAGALNVVIVPTPVEPSPEEVTP